MNYLYHLEFKLHVCRFLVLGFILMLVTISYLHINYKDKVQFHQRMTYSYLKPHVASLRIYFLLWCVAYLPWWHIVSYLIEVCFKESKLRLLRDSVVSVWAKFTSYVKSVMFSPYSFTANIRPVWCWFCVYWKALMKSFVKAMLVSFLLI